jgi:hypothetical protein
MEVAYQGFTSLDPDFPGPVIGPYSEFRQGVIHGLEAVIFDGADPKTTMDSVSEQFQTDLDAYAADVKG